MDYKQYVNETVIRNDNVRGKLVAVDENGYLEFKFDDGIYDGAFMYDPFIDELFRFENPSIQKQIDDYLINQDRKVIDLINEKSVSNPDEANYIFVSQEYHSDKETVIHMLKCDLGEFNQIAYFEIKKHKRVMVNTPEKYKPCVFKGYEAKTKKQIFQETFHPL